MEYLSLAVGATVPMIGDFVNDTSIIGLWREAAHDWENRQ
jgi:hypothetical protein